uniref:Apolipoprotein F n=1 Tax=Iconisemion striatum TaxID=60296 RepID=A0A1A7YT93_9TELE
MFSKWKWLIVMQLLLTEQVLSRVPPPLMKMNPLLQGTRPHEDAGEKVKQDHYTLLGSNSLSTLSSTDESGPESPLSQEEEDRVRSARLMTSVLRAKLQGRILDHLHIKENVSCEELLSASTVDDSLSSRFPQELLGLSLVPVLLVAGCQKEAQTLVLTLYNLLGKADTEELLMEVEALMERKMSRSTSTPAPASSAAAAPPSEREEPGRHIDAVMFNIQQLALMRDSTSSQVGQCGGWTQVNGTMLVGHAVKGASGGLEDAVSSCERLGVLCAGVTSGGPLMPGLYQAVLKKDSSIFPSVESECWIQLCSTQEEVLIVTASGQRTRRSPHRNCINENEERVYNVMEWIPGVSTLYNLGTAVYYASVNCTATAKERALLSAVDLGTDALMVATGGTAGVAGYALGAGVKTGVKAGVRYLLNSMKKEDEVLVNQLSTKEGTFTIQ